MRAEFLALSRILSIFVGFSAAWSVAHAQDPSAAEIEKLRQCDRDLCGIVVAPTKEGEPLRCDLSLTWNKDDIASAVKKGRLSWPFGDARCTAKFEIGHALLVAPFNEKKHTLKVPPQPVACEIDNPGALPHRLTAKMAPVIVFENGEAKSVSLGVTDIDGTAVVRNVVWAAWKFESNFGYFQADFVKGVNEYVKHCSNRTD